MTLILGISAFFHDSSASLIRNGEILGAVQEERFTRVKNDPSFPIKSIQYLLNEFKIKLNDIEFVTFYEKPILKFDRLLETYLTIAPKGFTSFLKSAPIWLKQKLFLKIIMLKKLKALDKNFKESKILFSNHHLSHAASAFYTSSFKEAVILTIDGVGEWATTSISIGKNNKIKLKKEIHFPHSIGLLYSAFTYYLGFKVNSGEYKVMGLAPYGKPIYYDLILDKIIDLKPDGSFQLNLEYFNFLNGLTMTNKKFNYLFGKKNRPFDSKKIDQFHMDVAASIQKVLDTIILKITRYIHNIYNIKNLCLAGGVALNCVTNSKILNDNKFDEIWIQPAAGDAGCSIGAALLTWHDLLKNKRIYKKNLMKNSFLGPSFKNSEIYSELIKEKITFLELEWNKLIDIVSNDLIEGKVIGWFQGAMEFGPRALGARSIIADPRNVNMQKKVNIKIKFRESFRPFAPSVLEENFKSFFNIKIKSPYMLFTAIIKERYKLIPSQNNGKSIGFKKLNEIRSKFPAITHLDYSSRLQTVDKKNNKKFYDLIKKFKLKTNCPMILNTSFNVRGEPIVRSPKDALDCFFNTNLDILVIGNFYIKKSNQKFKKIVSNKNFELD